MKISLHMNGRVVSFSEEELFSTLERRKNLKENFSIDEFVSESIYQTASKPTDGMCFKVNPATITSLIFQDKKTDFMQEWVRKCILRAIDEANKYPEKYIKPFATYVPLKIWKSKTVSEIKTFAQVNNSHIADWIEQSLEWAQRLINGESWESVCNAPDTLNWYRLVIWKNNRAKIVGGSHKCGDSLSATTVFGNNSKLDDVLYFTVPLIIVYL